MAQHDRTLTPRVLEAVVNMHAQEQIVTRETLSELTGLKMSTIDERLAFLTNNGKIRRVQRGVYVPVEQHPPSRPITRTLLPDGTTVLEIGDEVLHINPREARMIGELMSGSGVQYAAIQLGQQMQEVASDLATRVRRLEHGKQGG
jgi:hypothetical protein